MLTLYVMFDDAQFQERVAEEGVIRRVEAPEEIFQFLYERVRALRVRMREFSKKFFYLVVRVGDLGHRKMP